MEPTRAPVVVPQKGKIVLCRVVSVGYAMAKVRILSIDDTPLREELHGIIRREEIRAAEKDTVSVSNSYRPRDIVRARILSLGDIQAYSLTTAENELGVVLAKSSHDGHMIPISWCEMQCTVTGVKEKRKVAKVTDSVMV
jgi:exosome complex component CSL4